MTIFAERKTEIDMLKILVTYAVQGEFAEIKWPDAEVYYVRTGIGKMKSAYYLSEIIRQVEPDLVINQGTAGAKGHQIGEVLPCCLFIDRDMAKLAGMGAEFEISSSGLLEERGFLLQWINQLVCSSGDSFVSMQDELQGEVVDMEAFAQAFVCRAKNIPFIAVKYISNVIGETAPFRSTEEKLADIRQRLGDFFASLMHA